MWKTHFEENHAEDAFPPLFHQKPSGPFGGQKLVTLRVEDAVTAHLKEIARQTRGFFYVQHTAFDFDEIIAPKKGGRFCVIADDMSRPELLPIYYT